jgi:hypothetical protein
VFCTHGNEVDDWNIVDYNELGALTNNAMSDTWIPSDCKPNTGTRLVIDIMKQGKGDHTFSGTKLAQSPRAFV